MMEKTTIKTLGKTLSIVAIIIAGVGAFLLGIVKNLPEDTQGMINALAIFLVALGTYLSHKNQVVE